MFTVQKKHLYISAIIVACQPLLMTNITAQSIDTIPVIIRARSAEKEASGAMAKALVEDESGSRKKMKDELHRARRSHLGDILVELTALGLEKGRIIPAGNAISGWIDRDLIDDLEASRLVLEVFEDRVLDSQMNVSVPSLLPESFHNAGYRGQNSGFEVGILDAGIDATHPSLSSIDIRYHIDHSNAVGDSSYNDSSSNPDDLTLGGHGTHIAGIIAGRAAPTWESYTGVAPSLPRIYNLKSGFSRTGSDTAGLYFSDALDNIDWGIFSAADDIDTLNFSWGLSSSSDDSGLARFFDAMVVDLNIPVTIAAGNNGPNLGTITDPGIAYNVLTIGATNDVGTLYRGDDNVTGNSSRGPTFGGRKKPDLVAPGFLINSPTNIWESQLDFLNVSGTSFAAPHALGAVHLLMDYFGPSVSPLQVKALLIASASPGSFFDSTASIEWDPSWGWGLINLERAWDYRKNVYTNTISPNGSSGDYRLYRGTMEPVQRAALVWNRHVSYVSGGGQPSSASPLNNLNLFLYDHEGNTLLDSSTSGIDNVEVVSITARPYETVIKVNATDSTFSGVSYESYALSTPPGFTFPSNLPRPEADLYLLPGETPQLVAVIENSGDFNAHNVIASLSLPSGVSLLSGLDEKNLGTLKRNRGGRSIHSWTLDGGGNELSGNIQLGLSSLSYGERFTNSSSLQLAGSSTGLTVTLELSETTPMAGDPVTVTATVTNKSASIATDLNLSLIYEEAIILISGGTEQLLPNLGSGDSTEFSWQISLPESGTTGSLLATASGLTAGGGSLFGGDSASLTSTTRNQSQFLSVQEEAPTTVELGGVVEIRATVQNVSETTIDPVTVTLEAPNNFIAISGGTSQNFGAFEPTETRTSGRWIFFAPQSETVGDFKMTASGTDVDGMTTAFSVGVGRALPPIPKFQSELKDDPLLQSWTLSGDNDPVGLAGLNDGRFIFFNAQSGTSSGHRSFVSWDSKKQGSASLSVIATESQFKDLLGTVGDLSVVDMAAGSLDTVYVLVRLTSGTSSEPMALFKLKVGRDSNSLELLLEPGKYPIGLPSTADFRFAGIEWDEVNSRLLILSDNGNTADDAQLNGVFALAEGTDTMTTVATYGELGLSLEPAPRVGIDPIGFTAFASDNRGGFYLMNAGGLGGNLGDVIHWNDGEGRLFINDSDLQARLPLNFTEMETRISSDPISGSISILVTDSTTSSAAGEALMTRWNLDGSYQSLTASRSMLLDGTGAGLFLNYGQAMTTDKIGNTYLWSAADNEVLLTIPSSLGEGYFLY